MEFRCEPLNLCFNDGVCLTDNSTGFNVCICPNSYFGPDTSWFHDPSCTMPKIFPLAQFVEHTVLSWIAIVLLLNLIRTEKGRLKSTAFWSILATGSTWLYAMGFFIQQGSFEMCGFFLTCCLLFSSLCALELIHLQISVLKGVDQLIQYTVLTKSLNYTTVLCFAASIAIGLAWMILCRTTHYNTVTRTSLGSILFWNTMYVFEIYYYSGKLIVEIERLQRSLANHQDNPTVFQNWTALVDRLNRVRFAIGLYYVNLVAGTLPIFICHLVLGSAPYGFAMIMGALHCPIILSFGVFLLAKRKQNIGKGKSKVEESASALQDVTPHINVTPQDGGGSS